MTKAVNKNASPKVGKIQKGVSKNKGKTPDKKKLKEAAVKTPTTVTTLTPNVNGKKSKSTKKEIKKKSKEDYVTLELSDTKQPKVGKLTKAEKRKLKKARKREAEAAKKKEPESDEDEDEEDESEITVIENEAKEESTDEESKLDDEEEDDKEGEEEEEESSDNEVEAELDGSKEAEDDSEEEEEEEDSNEENAVDNDKESDDSAYKNETDSGSEPEEIKTVIKKKGMPNTEAEKKKKEKNKKPGNEKTNSELTVSFKGFQTGTEENVITDFLHGAVDAEEIDYMFIPKRKQNKSRGFGFVTLKTKEAFDKLLKLDGTEFGDKTIQMRKATFDPDKKPKNEAEKRKREDDSKSESVAKKQKNPYSKSDEATLCIKNIDFKATDDQLREHFENVVPQGGIKQVRFPKRDDGGSRGFAFIEFTSQEALEKAKELDGSEFNGRNLLVQVSVPNYSPKRNSNDFSKFRGNNKNFQNNRNFNNDRKPFNKNRNFDGRNKNFQNNKGKFGRESKGKGQFRNAKPNQGSMNESNKKRF